MSEKAVTKSSRAIPTLYWIVLGCWALVPIVAAALYGWRTLVFLFFVFLADGWMMLPTLFALLLPLILLPFALTRNHLVSE